MLQEQVFAVIRPKGCAKEHLSGSRYGSAGDVSARERCVRQSIIYPPSTTS
jgi:hypothetical protein